MKYIVIFVLLLISLHFSSHATIRNVPASYATIQSGLLACSTGDTVLVQPGTYFENIGWPNVGNIKLFSAGDSSNTIIDGGGIGTTIAFYGTPNSLDSNTIIKGFKITGGGCAIFQDRGCGFAIVNHSPKLKELAITGNYTSWIGIGGDGAGIWAENSDFLLINSSVYDNQIEIGTYGEGAGISINDGSPTITNVKIFNNYNARRGNGVACRDASPIFNNVSVYGNECNDSLAGSGNGAGMYFEDNISIILNNVTVFNNNSGFGASCRGGGIYFENDSSIILNSVSIQHNKSKYGIGAGIYFNGVTKVDLTNVIVENNVIEDEGYAAGIYLSADSAFFNNVLIHSNSLGKVNNFHKEIGISVSAHVNIFNSTIANNYLLDSLATNTQGIDIGPTATLNLTNSIVWNEDVGIEIYGNAANINTTYSNIRGGYTGTGNIDTLPGFVSATDFHLVPGSPCLGAGTLMGAPPLDLDSLPRPAPAGTNPDMGCFELDQPLGIQEIESKTHIINLYPNPSTGTINIKSTAVFTCVDVFDMMGKLILHKSTESYSQNTISMQSQPRGIYTLKLKLKNEEVLIEKFVVK